MTNAGAPGQGDDKRSHWLEMAVSVLSPLTLITALLVYFAWMRRIAFARALGINDGLLEEASIQAYLLRSSYTFFPLLVISLAVLLWVWIDGILRRWIRSGTHLRAVFRISWALSISATILFLGIVLVELASTAAKPYADVFWPVVVALAVLSAAHGASLRRLLNQEVADQSGKGRRSLINALIGLSAALLLFAGMDKFAQVAGNGQAEQIIWQPQQSTQAVMLYSAQDLQLDDTVAVRQELPGGEHAAYRYRYQGLRLVLVDSHHYFLIGRNWQDGDGTVLVLPRDGVRIEFMRGPS